MIPLRLEDALICITSIGPIAENDPLRLAFFLPHIGVTGGLGVHARTLLASLIECNEAFELTVVAPDNPAQLFPRSGIEPGWTELLQDPRFNLDLIKWPESANLADPLDAVLANRPAIQSADVIYTSYYTGMAHPPAPQIITFHDAGFLEFPEAFGSTASTRLNTLRLIKSSISAMHCVSADARDRICRLLPFDPSRTRVVWHALADEASAINSAKHESWRDRPLWEEGDTLRQWGRYAFFPVGAATGFNRRRKNVPLAVEAFRDANIPDFRLVIASTCLLDGGSLDQLLPRSEQLQGGAMIRGAWRSNDGRVIILPNLDRPQFLAAMAHSHVVYYPTRYEGFGLPAIEAMSLGIPLISGKTTSLIEVVGDAGILVNPDSRHDLSDALRATAYDSALRSRLTEQGCERSHLFSRSRLADGMMAMFHEFADRR